MKELMMKLWKDEEGQGLTEYALILGAIAVGVAIILLAIGGRVTAIFENIRDALIGVPV